MKFIIYSNAPTANTGYGVQVALLATRLTREGHSVAVACTWVHQVVVKDWPTPYGPVRLYPSGVLENSIDIFAAHADHWFEGDRDAGYVIILNDVWAFTSSMLQLDTFKVLAWCPVDHWPAPEGVLRWFAKTGAQPVAMSRFGQDMLNEAGLDAWYAPLAFDGASYKPTSTITVNGEQVPCRDVFKIPEEAFVVLMVAMNKDPSDRKSFNEGFRAFGRFWKEHKEAVLVVHSDRFGLYGSGINLQDLARHAAIPPHALIFTDAYAQRIGFPDEMLAGLYSAADVLLSPSRGEGFGVPMIEAQACGTPVVASDFTAQTELIGAGWLVTGQLQFDATQGASYLCPSVQDIFNKLMDAYDSDLLYKSMQSTVFAAQYEADKVFADHWLPILAKLEPQPPKADKPPVKALDIIVPLMRDNNRERFMRSLQAHTVTPYSLLEGVDGQTYAQNVNACYKQGSADWVVVVGDDCEFTAGWDTAAATLTDRYDVIGTNDSEPGRVRNPAVAKGSHADHFLIRRAYVEDEGASLDGPGVVVSEAYGHWYTDKELVELAKARGVFSPCLESVVIHHHPGYDGDETARETDPVYMRAVDTAEQDRKTWLKRVPLIQALRAGL
jgi:glycosyltransferase involved in cell wall biosynthesis